MTDRPDMNRNSGFFRIHNFLQEAKYQFGLDITRTIVSLRFIAKHFQGEMPKLSIHLFNVIKKTTIILTKQSLRIKIFCNCASARLQIL